MSKINWTKASEIGQAVSGILGVPIAFLAFLVISATLVLQYNEIVSNNKNLEMSREISRVETMLSTLRSDIDSASLIVIRNNAEIRFKGMEAFNYLDDSLKLYEEHTEILDSNLFHSLYFICGTVDTVLERITTSNLTEVERKYLLTSLIYLYTSKLAKPLITLQLLYENNKLHVDTSNKTSIMMTDKIVELHKKMVKLMAKEKV